METEMHEPVIDRLKNRKETVWLNPKLSAAEPYSKLSGYGFVYTQAAQNRFMRFLPYIADVFPETAAKKGVIESQLIEIPVMKEALNREGAGICGHLFLKDDAHLPIAGSVKARGGIHEVLRIAENVAMKEGLMNPAQDHRQLESEEVRKVFSRYTIQVGSTGNLGIAIGRTAAGMGFQAIVHMSSDAKEWKKELLRREGAIVKEYEGDYTQAVAAGRKASEGDPYSFFVDDENSKDLFFGYSTAALRLKVQLRKAKIPVDHEHPLFVYIPCGVGGAPGGITFGLKELFGEDVHCFFAEPVEAPCFTLGMASGRKAEICVQDIGLTGKTAADGLAVSRPSGFVCNMMEALVSGSFTVADERLLTYKEKMQTLEKIHLEPSACAGFRGIEEICRQDGPFRDYLLRNDLFTHMDRATHIVWGTGGGLSPE